MATITWSINSITILPQVGAYYDFAWQVNWSCAATDGTNTQSISSTVMFYPAQQAESYTPYDQLTEAQVIQWVKDTLGPETVAKTESVLTNMLTAQPAPLPWGE
jgi:hypothetical protein